MEYKKSILKNGIRIITAEMPQMRSVATTIYVGAGARYEDEKINGISHFLEHMVFKGTKKYPNQAEVARAIEGVGGQLNAWTDYEYTAYWNQVPKEHYERAFDVLAEMLNTPKLEKEAINRERGVIVEEINRSVDFPTTHVFDYLLELMWPEQPLGRNILGPKKNIQSISRQDFIHYLHKFYANTATVISVAGNIGHNEVVQEIERLFGKKSSHKAQISDSVVEKQIKPEAKIVNKKTDQCHLVIGIRGLSYSDDDKYAWKLMNTILGQGMSSRLFLKIREEKGLAYSIHSGDDSAKDTGLIYIQAGLNTQKLDKAIEAIMTELRLLADEPIPEQELREAKEYIKGGISLSMDDTDSVSSWYGRQELLMDEILTADETIKRIEKVTSEDIMKIAKRVFRSQNINLAVIGPIKESRKYEEMLTI